MNSIKITFEDLCDLVMDVDYIFDHTYPINFMVDGKEYLVGIGDYDCGDDTGDSLGVFGGTGELQYLMRYDMEDSDFKDVETGTLVKETYIDVINPDIVGYEYIEIIKLLKKQCNITNDSEIILFKESSFDGSRDYTIKWGLCSEEVKSRALKEYQKKN